MTDDNETDDVATPEDAPPERAEPADVAADFIRAAQEASAETGVVVTEVKRRGRRAAAATEPAPLTVPAAEWTEDGVGVMAVFATDMALTAGDMPGLEPEERSKVSKITTLYLNMRFPGAARVQPEVMLAGLIASIIGPRLLAKKAAQEAAKPVTPLHDDVPEGRG